MKGKQSQSRKQDFLLEILCEELPHGCLDPETGECRKIAEQMEKRLRAEKVSFTGMDFFLTPRRVAMLFREMEEDLPAQEIISNGPPLRICFQAGTPTPPLIGFMKGFLEKEGFGSPEEIPSWAEEKRLPGFYRKILGKDEFLIHYRYSPARPVSQVLKEVVPEVLSEITFTKSMYWGDRQGPFLRPIRSLVALFGKKVVPFSFAGIASGNRTWGHRFLSSPSSKRTGGVMIPEASLYQEILRKEKVIADPAERLDRVLQGVSAIEKERQVKVVSKIKVAQIVSALTEYPVPVYAEVDPELLAIPREVAVSEMVEHQMYFPVEDLQGNLTPGFIFTANGIHTSEVVTGNRNVLSSRLRDGIFLYREDIKAGLEKLSAKTDRIVFEKTLGTYAQKCDRVYHLSLSIQKAMGSSAEVFSGIDKETISAISRLIKCDLASAMVYEFPHLQGIMGEYYVKESSPASFRGVPLDEGIAAAVREHYLPLSARGILPKTGLGTLLSLADKLDNLMGLFAVGLAPSGNNDPYALRRQGYGLLRLLRENRICLDLQRLLTEGEKLYAGFRQEGLAAEVSEFLENRFKTYAKDCGFAPDEAEAVSLSGFDPYDRILKMEAIQAERTTPEFHVLAAALKRISHITQKFVIYQDLNYNSIIKDCHNRLTESAEKELYQMFQEIHSQTLSMSAYRELFQTFYRYPGIVGRFFDEVLVHVEDKELRETRLHLLQAVRGSVLKYFDLSKIQITDN